MPIPHHNLKLPPGVRQPIPGGALFDHANAEKAFKQWCKNNDVYESEEGRYSEAFYQGWHAHEKHLHYGSKE